MAPRLWQWVRTIQNSADEPSCERMAYVPTLPVTTRCLFASTAGKPIAAAQQQHHDERR